ncbi:MAG: hypothetical protein ACXWAT_16465, partial [Methylobacter sp.]
MPKVPVFCMSPKFIIRPSVEGDEQAILATFAHAFRDSRGKDIWHWIYRDNPEGSKSMLCISADGEVAAHFGASFHRAIYQGEAILIGQCRDAFSHPKFRSVVQGRIGLFANTARCLFSQYGVAEGTAFYYGFPSSQALRLGCKQLGYREGNNWGYFLCDTRKLSPVCDKHYGSLSATDKFGTEFDRLWNSRAKILKAAVVHDGRFLSWRFNTRLKPNYWIWTFTPYLSTEMVGYVIFSQRGHKVILMDLHLPSHAGTWHSFWAQILEKLRWHNIDEIETWLSLNHPDLARLREVGFLQHTLSADLKFCFRLFDGGPDWEN